MRVSLRKKPLKNGNRESLYLDISPAIVNPSTGKLTRKYYLKIFIYSKPVSELERNHNKETMELANYICAQRQIDVQNKRFHFVSDRSRKENFIDFFRELRDKRYHKKGQKKKRGKVIAEKNVKVETEFKVKPSSNWYTWDCAIKYFMDFAGEFISFNDITESFCEEYAEYLLAQPAVGRKEIPISLNTASTYFGRFRYALKVAYKKKLFSENLCDFVEAITPDETHREFLFLDEVQKLVDTACKFPVLKQASLVSCLTGLRYSDVAALRWSSVRGVVGNYVLHYTQEKTGGTEELPISDTVVMLMGSRGAEDDLVFPGLTYSLVDQNIGDWVKAAGIEKHITFHCFRHTFATLQLAAGTDVFTVSKLLGHRRLETTLIYVKIVDKLKQEAANRIGLDTSNIRIDMIV